MTWWSKQIEIAHAVRDYNRVAIKSGHSTGKSYGIAAIGIWFLHAYAPAIVITTAPSNQQVKDQIWRYMRKFVGQATVPLFKGLKPVDPAWNVEANCYAIGFATDTPERFRGIHGPNMFIIIDEGNGVPSFAWEEADNMCTASNNKIMTIGNPIKPTGEFYEAFKGSDWHTITVSCLDHPNVVNNREIYPGAVRRKWVDERVKKYAVPLEDPNDKQKGDFEWPAGSGVWYHPTPVFQSRVLGEFPDEGPNTLIPLSAIQFARDNKMPIDATQPVDMSVDVAYEGDDSCVVFARRGPSLLLRRKWRGKDTVKTELEVCKIVKSFTDQGIPVGTIAVDATGIGSGVASGLMVQKESGNIVCDQVVAVMVGEKANNNKEFENKRAELSFSLAKRFEDRNIDLSRLGEDADDFENQATQIEQDLSRSTLRKMIESKRTIKNRIGVSPDDFDAMYLLFIDTVDTFADCYSQVMLCE